MENPSKINGALPNTWDPRDYQWHKLAMASAPFNWYQGFDIEQKLGTKLTPNDQGTSGSCGGQTGRKYETVLDFVRKQVWTERSAKDIYSQIYQRGGGVVPRDLPAIICSKGVCEEQLIPSNRPDGSCDESFMEEKLQTPMTVADALTARGLSYASVRLDMDTIAQAIRDNYGCMISLGAANNGTWDTAYPQVSVKEEWAHFMYFGKAKMVNGKKMLGAINSWGPNVGDEGWQWFGEEWLPHFSSCYTIYEPANFPQPTASLMQQALTLLYKLISLIKK